MPRCGENKRRGTRGDRPSRINALIGELSLDHDRLAKNLDRRRLERVFNDFNALDALREDIGRIFATIRNT